MKKWAISLLSVSIISLLYSASSNKKISGEEFEKYRNETIHGENRYTQQSRYIPTLSSIAEITSSDDDTPDEINVVTPRDNHQHGASTPATDDREYN